MLSIQRPLTLALSLAALHGGFFPCHGAPDPEAELVTLRQVVEATPVVDTLGDFVATYSYRSVERDVCYSATDPGKKWTLHRSGMIETARRGDWVSFSITLAVPNPPELGGNVEQQVYRFFMRDGMPAGYSYGETFTEQQDNWSVTMSVPPFTTDLGMGWNGKTFIERSMLPQYFSEAYAQVGGLARSASTRSDGRRIEEFLSPPLPGAPGGTEVRIRIARESEGSGSLLTSESGRVYSFADGTSHFVPHATLEVSRHLDGLAAGFVVTQFDQGVAQGCGPLATAGDLVKCLDEAGPRVVVRQEEYQLLSIRRATDEDKVSPADFSRSLEVVRSTETGVERPIWRWTEGAEAPEPLLVYNVSTLEWEPPAPTQ